MHKKTIAAVALAVMAVFGAPAAANAAGYVPQDHVSVHGSPVANAVLEVVFAEKAFGHKGGIGEKVSIAATGAGRPNLSVFKAGTSTIVKAADSNGAVKTNITLPENATGTYTVTATGLETGNVGTATITVAAADSAAGAGSNSADGNLASTGYTAPMLLIWAAAGALLLGVAMVVVLNIVRRNRATA